MLVLFVVGLVRTYEAKKAMKRTLGFSKMDCHMDFLAMTSMMGN
jgi:hypothetical protein